MKAVYADMTKEKFFLVILSRGILNLKIKIMEKLQIKAVHRNKIVRKHLKGFGSISVDTSKLESQEDMLKWKRRGLDIFEEVKEAEEAPKKKASKGKSKPKEVKEEVEEVIEETETTEEEKEVEGIEEVKEEKPKARKPRKKASE